MKPRTFPTPEQACKRYPHGTRARYVLGKCRCFPCKITATNYEVDRESRSRNRWRLTKVKGEWIAYNKETGETARGEEAALFLLNREERPNQLIATDEVLAHCAMLSAAGVGTRTIAKQAPIARGTLKRILEGDIRKTRRSTADRILSVTTSAVREGARICADQTLALLDHLKAAGYRKTWIAAQLGYTAKVPSLQIKSGVIKIYNARKVHELYVRLMATNPRLPRIDPRFRPQGVVAESTLRKNQQAA
jgi:predicted transcriptional regulator